MTSFDMRPSRVLKVMRSGGVATCVKVNLADPRVVDLIAPCGFDCVWLDMEHVPNTLGDIENQVRAARARDVDTVVRVPRGSYSDLIRPLEMDATGIMVPHLMSLADARQVARQTKFHPIGRRPLDGGNADGAYGRLDPVEYVRQANEQRFVIVQIEDPEPMDELDEIAAVEGINMLLFGQADFSHGLGVLGQWDHPEIARARREVAAAAGRHGKFAGTVGGVGDAFDELVEMGYQFINVGADVIALTRYFDDLARQLAKLPGR